MSIEPIRDEVRGLLAQSNYDVRQAERTLAEGAGEDRVHAAGQLVLLKRRQADLLARMSELSRSPDDVGSTVFQWIKEDWMLLMRYMEHWIETR